MVSVYDLADAKVVASFACKKVFAVYTAAEVATFDVLFNAALLFACSVVNIL